MHTKHSSHYIHVCVVCVMPSTPLHFHWTIVPVLSPLSLSPSVQLPHSEKDDPEKEGNTATAGACGGLCELPSTHTQNCYFWTLTLPDIFFHLCRRQRSTSECYKLSSILRQVRWHHICVHVYVCACRRHLCAHLSHTHTHTSDANMFPS